MQKTKVTDDIEFAYRDSGAPSNKEDYLTIIIIHGYTYHSGTFLPMLEAAPSLGYRVITPNRPLYPGSTQYTKEETEAFDPINSPEDIASAYIKQGEYLLSFVSNMIKQHNLKRVVLTGWSLGSGFLSAMVRSISTFATDVKALRRQRIKALVWWDPPGTVHRLPNPPSGSWIPRDDEAITPELRGPTFIQWVTQYFPHPDLDKKDCTKLIYRNSTQTKPATFSGLPMEKHLTMIDITAGPRGDNIIGGRSFQPAARIIWQHTFLNNETRKEWGSVPFSVVYGEESPWTILWVVWELEVQSEKAGLPVSFRSMPGANHFPMQGDIIGVFETLSLCTQGINN